MHEMYGQQFIKIDCFTVPKAAQSWQGLDEKQTSLSSPAIEFSLWWEILVIGSSLYKANEKSST